MKKTLAILMAILLFALPVMGMAEGVTLKTASTFAGTDAGAGGYVELLREWEAATGNTVEDASQASDEAWKTSILQDVAVGGLDLVFFFAGADGEELVKDAVPIEEIIAAYPDAGIRYSDTLKAADGKVYALSVRPFWEALFVNKDLFEQYDLELPTDWAKFETAVAKFNEEGIVPISIALNDVPHYIVELAILASGSPDKHLLRPTSAEEMPDTWIKGMELIRKMYEMGCFAEDANNTTNALAGALFTSKQAAMQMDGSWYANGIAPEEWDSTVVMPFPAYDASADPTAIIGGDSMGFYVTRAAWDNPDKRDAVVSLLAHLTSEDAISRLGFAFGGELLKSSSAMIANASIIVPPMQDVMDKEIRGNYWFSKVPAMADGTLDITETMKAFADQAPFVVREEAPEDVPEETVEE